MDINDEDNLDPNRRLEVKGTLYSNMAVIEALEEIGQTKWSNWSWQYALPICDQEMRWYVLFLWRNSIPHENKILAMLMAY